MEQVAKVLGHNITRASQKLFKDLQLKEIKYHSKIFMKNLDHKQLNVWFGFHWCTQNMKIRVVNKKTRREFYKVVQPPWKLSYTFN
jgi:hypothetical protein